MATATKGNVTNSNSVPAANNYQIAHNQDTGDDRLIVIQLTMANTVNYSGCTYGGVAMTQLHSTNRGGLSQRMGFFYLQNPPTGNNTLRINFTGNQFNPISIHIRSFTNCGGVGNYERSGASTSPNTKNIVVSDDSLIMTTCCSINAITSLQIPTGTNRTYVQHNTNKQVGTGAISANSGHSAGTISVRSSSTFGTISLDRTEILGLSPPPVRDTDGDFFFFM
jgi:hypothetical protein